MPSPHPRQLLLDHADEALQRLGAHQQTTADEKGRDDWRPDTDVFLHILVASGMSSQRQFANKKGAPRPLLLPKDGLRAPAQTGIAVAPGIAFCYACSDHKGSPCGSGAGDGAPAKVLSSALFFCLCGVNAGGLGGSTIGCGQQHPTEVYSLLRA